MWLIFAVSPHQDDNSALEPSQANQPLLAIRFPVIFSGEHRFIENAIALRQIDAMPTQVELSLGGVIANVLFIVYALNGQRNGVAEQAVGADRHTASRARRMCVISLCTRGALDTWSRGRSTAALADMPTVSMQSRVRPPVPLAFKVLGVLLMLGAALFFVQVLLLGFSFTLAHNVFNVVLKATAFIAGYGFLRMKKWAVPLYFAGVAAAMLRMFVWPPTPELGALYVTPSGIGLALVMPATVGAVVVVYSNRFARDVG